MTSRVFNLLGIAALVSANGFAAEDRVVFNRDVRPILAEYCFHCHGPDPGSREEELRLDREEGFYNDRGGLGPTVVKGKPEKSPLYQRVAATDPDEIMPPPKSHKKLKPEEVAMLKKWIEQGAEWQPHWAFMAPVKPAVPGDAAGKEVDAFVRAKLATKGLQPAQQADRKTLVRRVSLDLTGLPPTPEVVEAFVGDAAPDAYEKLVDKLLASPRYGEHRGRYWLDAARYGDTHGLHFDNYREMWPYREWVIAAFNKNQPFDQFTVEQIAGDMLPNPTQEQRVATGFHRCLITTNEGGTIAEENLANYARDRVETTSWVWLGLTSNCAVCHDHKFDPITTKDFYAMSAFFRNTTQGDKDGNVKDSGPILRLPQGEDAKRLPAIEGEIAAVRKQIVEREKGIGAEFEKWQLTAKPGMLDAAVNNASLVAHVPLNEGAGKSVKARVDGKELEGKLSEKATWQEGGRLGAALVVGPDSALELGQVGDFEKNQPFSVSAWFFRPAATTSGTVVAKMDKGPGFQGWDVLVAGDEISVHIVSKWQENALKVTTTDQAAKADMWRNVTVTYDGSGKGKGVAIYVSGKKRAAKVDVNKLKGSIRTKVPFYVGKRSHSDAFSGAVQDVRVYKTALNAKQVLAIHELPDLRGILAKPAAQRSPEEKQRLLAFYTTGDSKTEEMRGKIAALEGEKTEIEKRSPVTFVQVEKTDAIPVAHILKRGQYDQPGEEVKPAVIAALHPMPAGAPANRLGLAQWLVAKENPLTARVTVNRFWQEFFGTGIVVSSEDMGIMSEAPSHPELLDWLAVDFRDHGWDVKRLVRQIVTSETYKQSATATPEKIERDPANRLLSRGPRFRMDAEMVRDYALAASGLLSDKIGGPSVKPYQPEGVWEAIAMPESNTRKYEQGKGEELYRRSMYTFWKRAAPPASMEIFNAPSRETCATRRERSNTPIQALVTLNDPQFIEAARNLAQLALKAAPGNADATLDFIARRVLCRPLRPAEVSVLHASRANLLTHYTQTPADAAALIAVGESKADAALPPPELAAWTMICNEVLNLDEVLNK